MRILISVAVAMFVAAFMAFGISQISVAATTPAAKAQCDAQRKACYAGQTQTGPSGERYVPPEVVKQCEEAYRACMARG